MGNRTNYGTGRMTVDNRQKNERSRSGNPYSSHVKAGKHAGTVYNFKRKSRIRKSLTRLPILLEFIHKYIFLNFVSFYNGLNSNYSYTVKRWFFSNSWTFYAILELSYKSLEIAGWIRFLQRNSWITWAVKTWWKLWESCRIRFKKRDRGTASERQAERTGIYERNAFRPSCACTKKTFRFFQWKIRRWIWTDGSV